MFTLTFSSHQHTASIHVHWWLHCPEEFKQICWDRILVQYRVFLLVFSAIARTYFIDCQEGVVAREQR